MIVAMSGEVAIHGPRTGKSSNGHVRFYTEGLGAFMLRIIAHRYGVKTTGPDPGITGGQYYLVLNGSLHFDGANYPAWSSVFVGRTDAPLEVHAGPGGVEVLVLNFPRLEN